MLRKSFALLVMGMVIFFLCSVASADVPDSINYQGKLTTAQGGCVNDTVQMTFSIYPDTLPATSADWTETQMQVVVKDGIFNVLLGSVTPLPASLFDGNAKYLGVQVESDPEMRPLKPMVSVAYAFRSEFSDTAEYARAAPAMPDDDWVIDGDNIYHELGNVGIGTTSPGTYKLNVNGTGYFGAQLNIMDPNYYLQLSGSDARIIFDSGSDWFRFDRTNNAYDFIIAADKVFSVKSASQYLRGNVGIGTLSPTQKLDVAGTAQMTGFKMPTSASSGYVLTSDASGVGTWQAAGGIGGSGTTNYVPKFTASTTLGNSAIYQSGSNVGLGTTTPAGKLHVETEKTYAGYFTSDSLSSNTHVVHAEYMGSGNYNAKAVYGYSRPADSYGFGGYFEGGRYGVFARVTPTGSQHYFGVLGSISGGSGVNYAVSGSAMGSGTNYGVYGYASGGTNNYAGYFSGDLCASGDVGIGTASPAEKLDVAGTAQMTGFKMPTSASSGYVLTSDASGVGTWQAAGGGGNWSVTDSVLYTNNYWGIARGGAGNVLYGDSAHTTVNLGVACTTGINGINYYYSTVSGGIGNKATTNYSTVGGGENNIASHYYATVGGGESNTASGDRSTIAGGLSNTASGGSSTVGGGESNTATYYSTVGGGISNTAGNDYSTVSGGGYNDASGDNSTVGGGHTNTASGISSTIDGGANNTASGGGSTVGGGWGNTASGHYGTVGGGYSDTSKALYGGVFSGYSNLAGDAEDDTAAFVGGGWDNSATARFATVSGGRENTASGYHSVTAGGYQNSNSGYCSVIPGGLRDTLTLYAYYSMAFGRDVYVNNANRVVFFDGSYSGRLGINRDDRDGGISYPIHVGTNTGNGYGAYLSAAGWWTSTSSRDFKENFKPLDGQELLAKISNLAVDSWEFKDSDERHIGPYAEDFVQAFDVGVIKEDGTRDNQYLAAGDVAGVALAGVKELAQQNQELRQIIEDLRQRIAELEKER